MGTLVYSAVSVAVSDAMEWPNEFAYRMVEQKTQYSVTGALLIESALKQTGRKIELKGGETWGWMARSVLQQICTWANLPGIELTLTFRGVTFNVAFDHEAGAVESMPIVPYQDPGAADFYAVTLRFIVV